MLIRSAAFVFALAVPALPLAAQTPGAPRAPSRADSNLVARILAAEDARDAGAGALRLGVARSEPRVAAIARRAVARINDSTFAGRDSLMSVPPAPAYPDPAWRLRFRALSTKPINCALLTRALSDSAWPVRLRAVDLTTPECASDTALMRTLHDWASTPAQRAKRAPGGVSWQPAAHALVALARLAPNDARPLAAQAAHSPIPSLRMYAARAATTLTDTVTLRTLSRDADENVREVAVIGLAAVAVHSADDDFLRVLGGRGYPAVRAAARALKGSTHGEEVFAAALAAAKRLRADSSETSRDARMALLDRIAEFATPANAAQVTPLASDFDCRIAESAARIARTEAKCRPLNSGVPAEAVALALGQDVRLRVTLADSSGGGSFVVRLRGDVAPIMAARVLALAKAHAYDNKTWYRVEPDFVIQGGGPGSNEYAGFPRFMRDELGTLSHSRGTVGMSTRGHDTGDGQWFVNLRDNARLTRDYTVFGEIVNGIEVADGILEGDVIKSIEVVAAATPAR